MARRPTPIALHPSTCQANGSMPSSGHSLDVRSSSTAAANFMKKADTLAIAKVVRVGAFWDFLIRGLRIATPVVSAYGQPAKKAVRKSKKSCEVATPSPFVSAMQELRLRRAG